MLSYLLLLNIFEYIIFFKNRFVINLNEKKKNFMYSIIKFKNN